MGADIRQRLQAFGVRLGSDRAEVMRGALVALVLRGGGALLAVGLNVAVGRLLGAEGAGLYFLALSVAMIGSVIARLGLENTILRFVASEATVANWSGVKGVARKSLTLAIAGSVIVGGALAIIAEPLAGALFDRPALAGHLQIAGLVVLGFSLMTLLAEALKGLKDIARSMIVSGILYPLVALACLWPMVTRFGELGAILAYAAGTLVATAIGAAMWHSKTRQWRDVDPSFEWRRIFDSARPLWAVTVLNRAVVPWMPLLLLGYWGSTSETGIFGAATRVAMLVSFFLIAVNTAIAPKFAELHRKGDIDGLARVARTFALVVTVAAAPIIAVLLFAGEWIMALFGPEFRSGGQALAILALGQATNVVTGAVGYLLTMSGHERDMRRAVVIAVVAMALVAVLAIPDFGMIGAAWSATVGVSMTNFLALYFVRKRLGFLVIPFPGSAR